jgi:glycosyltransferase involved in cell wall biosynthesis
LALKDKVYQITQPKRIETVHFGIDLQLFKPQKVDDLRKKLKLTNCRVIYCPRSIAPIYNTDILVEAFAEIASRKNLKLLLTVQNADESYLIEIEKKVIKYNLLDQIQFLPSLEFKEIPKLYNLADVVVSLTSSDGCSVSFLEAMALKKKIVATDLPYLKDWRKENNLWIVPVRDSSATAKALSKALEFPLKKWQPIGERNRQLVVQKAEINRNFEKLDGFYQKLLLK